MIFFSVFKSSKKWTFSFLNWPILESRTKICKKKVHLLEDLKTPKFHSEINWPLSLWVLVHCIWYVPILLPLARKNDDKGYRRPAVYRHRELRIIYMQQKQIGCRLQNCFVLGAFLYLCWPNSDLNPLYC